MHDSFGLLGSGLSSVFSIMVATGSVRRLFQQFSSKVGVSYAPAAAEGNPFLGALAGPAVFHLSGKFAAARGVAQLALVRQQRTLTKFDTL